MTRRALVVIRCRACGRPLGEVTGPPPGWGAVLLVPPCPRHRPANAMIAAMARREPVWEAMAGADGAVPVAWAALRPALRRAARTGRRQTFKI